MSTSLHALWNEDQSFEADRSAIALEVVPENGIAVFLERRLVEVLVFVVSDIFGFTIVTNQYDTQKRRNT